MAQTTEADEIGRHGDFGSRRGWRGTGQGIAGLERTARDRRDGSPTLGLYEEARVQRAPKQPVRVSPHRWTTLWGASILGLPNTAERLLRAGASPNARDADGKTAAMYAAEWGQPDVLRTLFDWDADPNASDRDKRTPVFYAEGSKAARVLGLLQHAGANLNAVNHLGLTALMEAAHRGNLTALDTLLEVGADSNVSNEHGHTALLYAVSRKRTESERRLLSMGANAGFAEVLASGDAVSAAHLPTNVVLDAPLWSGGHGAASVAETLLSRASRRGNFGAVRLLLERGADPNATPGNEVCPLDAAAEAGRGRIVRLLLDYGADPGQAKMDTAQLRRWAGLDEEQR